MPQVFPKSANVIARVIIWGGLAGLAFVSWAAFYVYESPYVTRANVYMPQPVPFSHQHHVQGLGLDCRYCHKGVETSAYAGMPSTETCMTCHSQLYTDAPALAPVRTSWATNVPIVWNRLNKLPDYVYFDHSIHINKGVGCVECHGQVDQMPLTLKAKDFEMRFCLDCHAKPAMHLRPRDEVFNMHWTPPPDHDALAAALMKQYHIPGRRLTNCSTCHR